MDYRYYALCDVVRKIKQLKAVAGTVACAMAAKGKEEECFMRTEGVEETMILMRDVFCDLENALNQIISNGSK